uniref:Uncharacterized protein n=1 Tax=Meloidogyne enterolobii TaxID=390850 RepID=A0A6V7Y2K2_MELEN|nr:unnamed protein product [Meloidogyne enterolobii]
MAEEGLSTNSDWILIEKEKNDLINLQIKFIEEKEKNLNFEKNNILLENELRQMDKKIQKINLDHKNEIEEIKLNFQKLIDKRFQQLKMKMIERTRKLTLWKKKLKSQMIYLK